MRNNTFDPFSASYSSLAHNVHPMTYSNAVYLGMLYATLAHAVVGHDCNKINKGTN